MATVEQVARMALMAIKVQGSESSLEGDDYEDFIFELNNFMAELESRGISLGYTVVDSLSDEVTIPAGAVGGLISNMAIRVSPAYGGAISDALIATAEVGMNTLRALGMSIKDSVYPATLNKGIANEYFSGDAFYSGES
jgi:hypothetical protein